jgi:hypothetical protein
MSKYLWNNMVPQRQSYSFGAARYTQLGEDTADM